MFRLRNFAINLDPINDFEKLKTILSDNIKASILINVSSLNKEEELKLSAVGVDSISMELKKEMRTQADIKDWYDSLDEQEKERYAGVIKVIDNEKELKIN